MDSSSRTAIALFFLLAWVFGDGEVRAARESGNADPPRTVLTELPNGIRILCLPLEGRQLVQVDTYLSLRGAARDEEIGHLVEHLMFTSSENCPAGALRDSLRLLTTACNAYTTARNIHASSRCLPGLLPRFLAVEAERFFRLKPDATDLEREKHRIAGEIDFRREASSRWAVDREIASMAYLGRVGRGTGQQGKQKVAALTLADVDSFITGRARPDQTVILISGPVAPTFVDSLSRAVFGDVPPAAGEPEVAPIPEVAYRKARPMWSDDDLDVLGVGFRLPYGTPEEAALVHLTDTIMKRENGKPTLVIFEDEALLILHLEGDWSDSHFLDTARSLALGQFWEETRTVIRNAGDGWRLKKNREAHHEGFLSRLNEPMLAAEWRATRLAEGRDLPSAATMAAIIDTLSETTLQAYFREHLAWERSFVAFAGGQAVNPTYQHLINRGLGFAVNPYLIPHADRRGLDRDDIDPILADGAALGAGRLETFRLDNGIPVHNLKITGTDSLFMGGVRTYPVSPDEARNKNPGCFLLYRLLVNAGYDAKGYKVKPMGHEQKSGTILDPMIDAMTITAADDVEDLNLMTASMHKRIKVDRLHFYAHQWLIENREEWCRQLDDLTVLEAHTRRIELMFGRDHPLAYWLKPDPESIGEWSLDQAGKLHRRVCDTGNLQLVAVGDVDLSRLQESLSRNFGKRPDYDPAGHPILAPGAGTPTGVVVHEGGCRVADCRIQFPPRDLAALPAVDPVALLVLARVIEDRMLMGLESADIDSVYLRVVIEHVGSAAWPGLEAVCPPWKSDEVMTLIDGVLQDVRSRPSTVDEEARARLAIMGPMIEEFLDPMRARDMLLWFGHFGMIEPDILKRLAEMEYGHLAPRAAEFFPAEEYVWTLLADQSRLGPSEPTVTGDGPESEKPATSSGK